MAKKNSLSSGIDSLLSGMGKNKALESTGIYSIPESENASANEVLKATKGYGRKTFIISSELTESIEAWAWYSPGTERDHVEKAIGQYLGTVDQAELQIARDLFRKKKNR